MKLKGEFELVPVDEFEKKVVAHGEAEQIFGNVLAASESVNYVFQFLMNETSEEEVVNNMKKTFEAPEEDIKEDVHTVINALRNKGFLEE